jgi:hypothetical protein
MGFLTPKGSKPKPVAAASVSGIDASSDSDDDSIRNNDSVVPEQAPTSTITEYKFGMAERLQLAVASKAGLTVKRSPDLVPLGKQFDAMRKQMRQLIQTAKTLHSSMEKVNVDRVKVSAFRAIRAKRYQEARKSIR